MSADKDITQTPTQAGPPLWLPATVFAALFCAGLILATSDTATIPSLHANDTILSAFLQSRSDALQPAAALWFGAAVPLGIVTAGLVSRLHFLGVRAVGPSIALFGGGVAAISLMIAASILWALTAADAGEGANGAGALFRLALVLGGPGFAVPLGLLIAGIAIPCAILKLLPRWIACAGLFPALLGELSWLALFSPHFLPFVPLTGCAGLPWLILVGILLPASPPQPASRAKSVQNGV